MTWFIFIGDLIVMAAMFGVVVWVFLRANADDLADAARIPLDDEGDGDAESNRQKPYSATPAKERHPRSLLAGAGVQRLKNGDAHA